MPFELFSEVVLTQEFSEYGLKRGAVGTIVEHYPMTDQEDGYSIEGFNLPAVTLEVSQSQIMSISQWNEEQAILQKIHQLPMDKLDELDRYLDQLTA